MQGRWVLLTLVCVAFLVIGQLLFKRAAAQWRVEGLSLVTVTSFFTPTLIAALVLFAAFVAYAISGYVVSGWMMLRERRRRVADTA